MRRRIGLRSRVGKLLGTRPKTYSEGSASSAVVQIGEPEAERRADPGEPQGRQGVENDTRRTSAGQWPTQLGTGRRLESYICLHVVYELEPPLKKESGRPEIQSQQPQTPQEIQPLTLLRTPHKISDPAFREKGNDEK